MISTILVPLDGSPEAEQALPYARVLVPDRGSLLLFRAVPDAGPLGADEPALTELNWALEPDSGTAGKTGPDPAQADLGRLAARMVDSGARCATELVQGDPATQILQAIMQRQVDLVAMTTHGRSALGRAVFGSVADRIVRTSPVPVMLVRPDGAAVDAASARIDRLLVPLDGSELAEAALPVAAELAQRLAVPVHLVRAISAASVLASLSGGSFFTPSPPQGVYEQMIGEMEASARAYLASVAGRLQTQGIEVSWAVLAGSPYFEISNAAQPHDLLVLTSHGRGGVMRWLLGSVAEKLVREAPAPVLLVPAENRGSPELIAGD